MRPSNSVTPPAVWAGGIEAFERLTTLFYDKVLADDILEPVFRHMDKEHARHVAAFMVETLMGPKLYSEMYGQDALQHMVGKHVGKRLQEFQRKRWVDLLVASADEIGLAPDPEFRSTFMAHLEWGSRVAVINSQLTENPTTPDQQIPQWGWGEVRGPYDEVGSLFCPPGDSNAQ